MADLGPEVRDFLTAGTRTGKLGWVAVDGRPLVAPVWFVLDGNELLFNTGAETAKGRALRRDARAVLCVDDEVPPFGYVQVQGTVELIDDLDEIRRWATTIAARYMGDALAPAYGERNGVPGELLVRLTPTKVIAEFGVAD
jgi:PPOX class probable F420-dependent enzyme